MHDWILILSLSLGVCLCANVPPVALVDNIPASTEGYNEVLDSGSNMQNDTILDLDSIGHHKIVGGYDATLGEAPWQVALITSFGSLICGGTLLSPRVVLTAAHCMIGYSFNVHLGGVDRTNLPQQYSVKDVHVHQNYNSRTYDNDIALVILGETVDFQSLDDVEPASLPTSDYDNEDYVNDNVIISGWGTISSGNTAKPNELQAAEVQIFSEDICKKSYGRRFSDNMICAGVETYTKDSCQGDSGGPLVLQEESTNTLLGITSWGSGCALQGYPGVYTKVSNYISWIEGKACSSNACFVSHVKSNTNNTAIATTSGYLLPCALVSVIWR